MYFKYSAETYCLVEIFLHTHTRCSAPIYKVTKQKQMKLLLQGSIEKLLQKFYTAFTIGIKLIL